MAKETEEASRDTRLLQRITLRNILSFGPDTPELELRALNVLIGPNGSGKSNLLACLSLLPAIPNDFSKAFQLDDNQLTDWFWQHQFSRPATLEMLVAAPAGLVGHELSFRADTGLLQLVRETVRTYALGQVSDEVPYLADFTTSPPLIKFNGAVREGFGVSNYLSILQQLRDPTTYPSFSQLTTAYQRIFFFRHWTFGSEAAIRRPRPVAHTREFLNEGGDNLTRILHQLKGDPMWKARFISLLNELYEGIDNYETFVRSGYVELFLREGDKSIPTTRLSDGTLRFMCLLVILLHPEPPLLICLEEPELGLHPDAVLAVGRLVKEASERTQFVVTTHSDILVDVLGQQPEDIIVCEKHEGQTQLTRLREPELRGWLERYSLSQLWTRGKLGGTRW